MLARASSGVYSRDQLLLAFVTVEAVVGTKEAERCINADQSALQ
jgi:hypothetical protein